MFCQDCGARVQPGQSYCGACSRPLSGYQVARPSRLGTHIHLLGIFWIAYSVFSLLGGVVLLVLANTLFRGLAYDSRMPEFLHPLLTAVAVFLLFKALAGIAAGYGLLQRESWARVLALVLGFLNLLQVPFGTALGIYTIAILIPPGADAEYRALRAVASV